MVCHPCQWHILPKSQPGGSTRKCHMWDRCLCEPSCSYHSDSIRPSLPRKLFRSLSKLLPMDQEEVPCAEENPTVSLRKPPSGWSCYFRLLRRDSKPIWFRFRGIWLQKLGAGLCQFPCKTSSSGTSALPVPVPGPPRFAECLHWLLQVESWVLMERHCVPTLPVFKVSLVKNNKNMKHENWF